MKKTILNYLFILTGCFILSLGIVGFLEPNKIATGGTAGLAIVLHYLFGLSTGTLFALINIPLLLLSVRYIGRHFAIKSIIAILAMVVMIDGLVKWGNLEALSHDPLLATLYGGVAVGIGLGLIFKGGGSAGGGSIIAKMVSTKYAIKTGTVVFVLDAIVVVSAAFTFDNIELALWSMISIFASTKMIDVVLTGRSNEKIVHISSHKSLSELGSLIHEAIGVSGTYVKGYNIGLNEKKDIIFITVPKNRLNVLKQLVFEFDKGARMIVMEAAEMNGGAFNSLN